MKHNLHYRAKPSSRKSKNAKSSKSNARRANPSREILLESCLIDMQASQPGFDAMEALPYFKDTRKDKTKCGDVAISLSPQIDEDRPLEGLLVMFDSADAKKAKSVGSLVKKNPDITNQIASKAKSQTATAVAFDLQRLSNNLGASDAAVTSVGLLQSTAGGGLMLFPDNPEAAFLAGVHQGYEIVLRTCPSAKIPGIGVVSKNWRELRSILKTRNKIEKDVIRDIGLPSSPLVVSSDRKGQVLVTQKGQSLSRHIGKLKAKRKRIDIPEDAWNAYYLGVHIGMLEGYEACPLKWVPFHKGFKKVNATLKALRDTRRHAGAFKAIERLDPSEKS